jgi:hypothetical protein
MTTRRGSRSLPPNCEVVNCWSLCHFYLLPPFEASTPWVLQSPAETQQQVELRLSTLISRLNLSKICANFFFGRVVDGGEGVRVTAAHLNCWRQMDGSIRLFKCVVALYAGVIGTLIRVCLLCLSSSWLTGTMGYITTKATLRDLCDVLGRVLYWHLPSSMPWTWNKCQI